MVGTHRVLVVVLLLLASLVGCRQSPLVPISKADPQAGELRVWADDQLIGVVVVGDLALDRILARLPDSLRHELERTGRFESDDPLVIRGVAGALGDVQPKVGVERDIHSVSWGKIKGLYTG